MIADGKEVVGVHAPTFSLAAVLVVLPAIIALIAENTGHVKAVAEMTGANLDDVMGRAIAADGVATMVATSVGGSPTTTYAENIGVMAASRVYSTAAYYVAALIAIMSLVVLETVVLLGKPEVDGDLLAQSAHCASPSLFFPPLD